MNTRTLVFELFDKDIPLPIDGHTKLALSPELLTRAAQKALKLRNAAYQRAPHLRASAEQATRLGDVDGMGRMMGHFSDNEADIAKRFAQSQKFQAGAKARGGLPESRPTPGASDMPPGGILAGRILEGGAAPAGDAAAGKGFMDYLKAMGGRAAEIGGDAVRAGSYLGNTALDMYRKPGLLRDLTNTGVGVGGGVGIAEILRHLGGSAPSAPPVKSAGMMQGIPGLTGVTTPQRPSIGAALPNSSTLPPLAPPATHAVNLGQTSIGNPNGTPPAAPAPSATVGNPNGMPPAAPAAPPTFSMGNPNGVQQPAAAPAAPAAPAGLTVVTNGVQPNPIDAGAMAEFRRQHGTAFNPRSVMDRRKMQQMQRMAQMFQTTADGMPQISKSAALLAELAYRQEQGTKVANAVGLAFGIPAPGWIDRMEYWELIAPSEVVKAASTIPVILLNEMVKVAWLQAARAAIPAVGKMVTTTAPRALNAGKGLLASSAEALGGGARAAEALKSVGSTASEAVSPIQKMMAKWRSISGPKLAYPPEVMASKLRPTFSRPTNFGWEGSQLARRSAEAVPRMVNPTNRGADALKAWSDGMNNPTSLLGRIGQWGAKTAPGVQANSARFAEQLAHASQPMNAAFQQLPQWGQSALRGIGTTGRFAGRTAMGAGFPGFMLWNGIAAHGGAQAAQAQMQQRAAELQKQLSTGISGFADSSILNRAQLAAAMLFQPGKLKEFAGRVGDPEFLKTLMAAAPK